MMRKCLAGCLLVVVFASADALGVDTSVAWWGFDGEGAEKVEGNFSYVDGVRGKALRLDGYTTHVVRKAGDVPDIAGGFTVEAWAALQTYPWNWTAILDQQGEVIEPVAPAVPDEVREEDLDRGFVGVRYESPDLERPDEDDVLEKLDNDWTGQGNDWSARWYGYIQGPHTGLVQFSAIANNGMKFVIDGKTIIDNWGEGSALIGSMEMVKGKMYPVELSYFQDGGKSILYLGWVWGTRGERAVGPLWHSEAQAQKAKEERRGKEKSKPSRTRLSFGIDNDGRLGLKINVDGRLRECVSDRQLELLKWNHVAATFDGDSEIVLYVNSEPAGSLAFKGRLSSEGLSDLLIGKSHEKMSPVETIRDASRKTMSDMVLDGLLDEVKIFSEALSAERIGKDYSESRPVVEQPLNYRVLPSGPKDVPKRFAGYYTRLRYDEQWEKLWRVGEHPDILVTFDESPVRVLFWRGTNYGASWVTENGIWMSDQSLEDSGTGWGLSEHMADKQNRYSHVRLIENHDARVVIHWRYAVCDIRYMINHEDKVTGWGDWTDEYYYIYPDVVATRKQILHTSAFGGFQWQETIMFNQPGTRPEDNVEWESLTLVNMDGQTKSYSWKDGSPDEFDGPKGANIQLTNLKAKYRPFIVFTPGREIKAFGEGGKGSMFPWWDHWPVSMIPSDGRDTHSVDRPSHSSLSYSKPRAEHLGGKSYAAVHLFGMTDKGAAELVPLARSWNYPAALEIMSGDFESKGYDQYQRAYVIERKGAGSELELVLAGSEKSPVVNPAFVVKNWGRRSVGLKIDGREVERGAGFRFGFGSTVEGMDLVVWLKKGIVGQMKVELSPAD